MTRLQAIEKRLAEAPDKPWRAGTTEGRLGAWVQSASEVKIITTTGAFPLCHERTVEFIAHAHADLAALLAVAKAADTLVREDGLCSCEDCTERASALTKALAALEKETA